MQQIGYGKRFKSNFFFEKKRKDLEDLYWPLEITHEVVNNLSVRKVKAEGRGHCTGTL